MIGRLHVLNADVGVIGLALAWRAGPCCRGRLRSTRSTAAMARTGPAPAGRRVRGVAVLGAVMRIDRPDRPDRTVAALLSAREEHP